MHEHKEERDERYKSNQMKLLKLKKSEIRNLLNEVSVQFTRLVVSDSLRQHGLQHTRPPCPSPTPRAYSNSLPLSQWCHPTISSSVVPFSRLQSFPASGSFQMKQFFAPGGQSIGASASASVLPMSIQDWLPLRLTGLISLLYKGLSRVSSRTTIGKYQLCWIWNKTELETTENPVGFRLCPSLKYKSESHWIGSLPLLQRIFPTQGSNPCLPHCRWILHQLSHKGC